MEKRGISKTGWAPSEGDCSVIGAGDGKLLYEQMTKRISSRAGSDEREMKVTSSRYRKIQGVNEDNERRQEKCTLAWTCLDLGDPAAAPCLCKQGEAARLKHPQRKTFAAVIKWCTANPPGWLRSGFGDCPLLYRSHVDCKQQPSRELSLENI